MNKNSVFGLVLVLLLIVGLFSCSSSDEAHQETPPETYPLVRITTSMGDMHFWLFDETPNHKAKFIELAKLGHYNQFTMNRIIRNFVCQGGCPDSVQYFENSPYLLDPEFVDSIKHVYGALGIGRDGNAEKQSNVCQFYIVNKEAGLPNLDGDYMIIGKIVKGEDVLEAMEIVKTDSDDKPLDDLNLEVGIENYTKTELLDGFGLVL